MEGVYTAIVVFPYEVSTLSFVLVIYYFHACLYSCSYSNIPSILVLIDWQRKDYYKNYKCNVFTGNYKTNPFT